MAGFAALLLTGRMSAGHPTAAIGMEFDAIAAVIVGGTSFERGKGSLGGTLIGVVTIGVLKNGLNVLEVPSSLQVASIGVLIIVALVIESIPAAGRAARVEVGVKTLAYRLIAVALIGVGALVDHRVVSHGREHAQRPPAGEPDVPHRVGADADDSHGRARSVGRRERRPVRLPGRDGDEVHAARSRSASATGLVFGAVVGILNGLMVTLLRLPPFIATYGMLWTLNGVTYWFMGGDTIHGFSPGFRALGSGYWLGVPFPSI